jgi:hypothetical protein
LGEKRCHGSSGAVAQEWWRLRRGGARTVVAAAVMHWLEVGDGGGGPRWDGVCHWGRMPSGLGGGVFC